MAITNPLLIVSPTLRRRNDVTLVLDRPCSQQRVPVRLPSGYREDTWNEQYLGPSSFPVGVTLSECGVEFRKAQVVTGCETQPS